MIALLIARAFAILALQAQPEPQAPEYVRPLIAECTPVISADFVGCELRTHYAGLVLVYNDADTSAAYTFDVH